MQVVELRSEDASFGADAMRVVFMGPPGAGKGTQAKIAAKELGVAHISTGEMLRAAVDAGSILGNRVKQIMERGQLVPDDLMVSLISERVLEPDCQAGYILDGFPRTVSQANSLDAMLEVKGEKLDLALYFDVPSTEVLNRLEMRRVQEGRSDDTIATQRERLKIYEEQTFPLIDYYTSNGLLKKVDGMGDVEEIQARVVEVLKSCQSN